MPESTLHEELTTGAKFLGGEDYYKQNIPDCIRPNLNPKFELRDYQREAFGRFQYYLEKYPNRSSPIQVLYQMATGSGKTLVMAGLILYLYQQGYRNFLFFVNSKNIIDKTIANFLNKTASKYLFAESIQIDDRQIRIREVDNFQAGNPADVNLVFSTIQGLHSRLNEPHENSLTYDDFKDEKIVLISDEAHHINVETKRAKRLSKEERDERTWESTVKRIFEANSDNVLLEFTATADLTNEQILEKYRDKIIFDYPLKQFRLDGYSKEVKVLQADIEVMDRALQAVLLSQFRRKVFERHGRLIKPVVLFKSRTIKESRAFLDEFIARMKSLQGSHLQKIQDSPNLEPVLRAVFGYFSENGISMDNLALELREDFNEDRCIAVNSKDESEHKQIAVNTLEDKDNEYRAIFVVDQLNEGWDVLNLFDIVRLYDTRDARAGKPGRTTLSEAQLIGRGARYCPFRLDDDQPLYKRKYDSYTATEHELKVCEELYYHSAYNPRYIQELHTALEEIGITDRERRQYSLELKPEFKEKAFYKNGFTFQNERIKNTREDVTGLSASFIATAHKVSLRTGYSQTTSAFEPPPEMGQPDTKRKDYDILSFGVRVIRKALNQFSEYQFDNLQRLFPKLRSMSEFMTSEQYLGKVRAEVETSEDRINDLTQDDKLYIVHELLKRLIRQLQAENVEYKGTKEFTPHPVKDIFSDKTLHVVNDGGGDREYGVAQSTTANLSLRIDLSNKDWFVFNENYGTSEEKHLVRYIDKVMDGLKQKYGEVYLVRNQQHFQLFNFDDGRAFEPDFVLFLIEDGGTKPLQYQVFIEPKGEHLIEHDKWKQEFLMRLEKEHKIEQLWMDRDYVVWGMPFYNETKPEVRQDFEEAFGVLTD